MTEKYLDEKALLKQLGKITLSDIEVTTTDAYNEMEVLKAVKSTGLVQELCACSIQIAVSGAGGGNYGTVKLGSRDIDLISIFKRAGVFVGNPRGAKLKESDLTPRRLCRLFRSHIKKYIQMTGKMSYLQRKYGTTDMKDSIYFPGSEHMVSNSQEAEHLLEIYGNLDRAHETDIQSRISRVLMAQGYHVSGEVET